MNYYRSDGWVKNTLGAAIPGAQIYVLSQPANVVPPITPPRTTPVPFVPNPQVQVYSDQGLTPIVQPIITDGFGHYDFYVLPGLYTVAVYYGGTLQNYYIDQSIGNVGSSGGAGILLETNGTPNFDQTLQNLMQGDGITLFSDNLGNVTITATGGGPSVVFETNGIENPNQGLLNLVGEEGISISTSPTSTTISSPNQLQQYSQSFFIAWMASTQANSINTIMDQIFETDSGATETHFAATATNGMVNTYSTSGIEERLYVGNLAFWTARGINYQARYTSEIPSTAQMNVYHGLSSSGAITESTTYCIVFGLTKTLSTDPVGNYQAVCQNGAVSTKVDTGVQAGDGVWHDFEIVVAVGAASVAFYIDGNLVATIASNIPVQALGLALSTNSTSFSVPTTSHSFEYLFAQAPTI